MMKKYILALIAIPMLALSQTKTESSSIPTTPQSAVPLSNAIINVHHNSVMLMNWAEKMCNTGSEAFLKSYGAHNIHCFKSMSENDHTQDAKKKELNATFQLDLIRGLDGYTRVTITNLRQKDPLIANKTGWLIQDDPKFQTVLEDRLKNSRFPLTHMNLIRDAFVELALESKKIDPKLRSKDENYKLLINNPEWSKETRQYLMAGTLLASTLSFGWYGYHYLTNNVPDYDYSDFTETLKNKIRFGSMARFDDNSFRTNINHSLAGFVYYTECRGVGLSALQSYLCTLAASTVWEAIIEWREVYSINDQIFTTHGGAIMGEAAHQMGRYLFKKGPDWLKKSLGLLWSAPARTTNSINKKFFAGLNGDLDGAYEGDLSGKFEIEMGTVKYANGQSQKTIGIKNDIVTIANWDSSGSDTGFNSGVASTTFNFEAPMNDIYNQYKLFTKVVVAAYHQKQVTESANGQLSGYKFFVGPSAALELRNKDTNFSNDFMGITHIAGATAQITNYYKGFKITSTIDFWGDSYMIKSFNIEDYRNQNGNNNLVANLKDQDYYHGFGYTSKGQIIVEYGKWAAGASYQSSNATNTNARQRDLGQTLTELNIQDRLQTAEVFVERKLTENLSIKFAVENVKRSGKIESYGQRTESTNKYKFFITYHF
jgi:hypothetical protein